MRHSGRDTKADRVAAALVALPALLELALILHHPVPARSPGPQGAADPFGGIAAVIAENRAFHAALILLLLAQLTGVTLLARRLGSHRPLVIAGGVFFGTGAFLLLLATTNDGFVTYELISRCMTSAGGCTEQTRGALNMILASVQAFTKLGFIGQSLGFAALAGSLMVAGSRLSVAGAAGVVLALVPLALLTSAAYVGSAMIMQLLVAHAALGVGAAVLITSGWLDCLTSAGLGGDAGKPTARGIGTVPAQQSDAKGDG